MCFWHRQGKATLKVATAAGGAALALEPSAGKVALKKAEVEAQEKAQKSGEESLFRFEVAFGEKKCAEKDTETLAECEDLTKENTKYHESLSAVLSELMMLKAELKKAEAEKADADAAASKTNAEAEKKEEDSGMPIAVIAGGAAAVVVIILLVVFILMSGGSKSDGKADANRNVVAFENPMYDDPNAGQKANPMYSDGPAPAMYDEGTYGAPAEAEAPAPGGGALYDEPAFQPETAGANGYLDVAPDDDDEEDDEDEDEDSSEEDDE